MASLPLVADENVSGDIIRGLLRRNPELDLVRVQDVGLYAAPDPEVLAWAADQGRVLITSDKNTIIEFAYERVVAGLPMPGVFEVAQDAAIGRVIDDLLALALASKPGEWENQICYVPLR